jgi:isopentenyl-diphosphate delta-isomerase
MAGYGIDDVPTLTLDEGQRKNLVSEDQTQAELMAEAVIQVSENDQVIGPISKLDSHSGAGEYHRAFSVLLFNSNNELLLQRRSMDKVTFPGVWANSCCSHPLHSEEELDEGNAMGVKRAAVRKLEQELGISPDSISIEDFVFMTKMRYSSRMNQEWIERELDHILVIQADVDVNPNTNEVSEVMWVNRDQLEMMLLEERAAEEAVAPWFRCIAARVMNPNWWAAIGNIAELEALSDDEIHDMGDVSHMLPNAIGADLITSIREVKPLVEQRIESSLRASRHPRPCRCNDAPH